MVALPAPLLELLRGRALCYIATSMPCGSPQRYRGEPYSWWGGRDQQRVIIVIEPEHIHSPRG